MGGWVPRSENTVANCDILSDTKEAEKVLRSKKPGVHRQEEAVFYQKQKSTQLTLKVTQMPAAPPGVSL